MREHTAEGTRENHRKTTSAGANAVSRPVHQCQPRPTMNRRNKQYQVHFHQKRIDTGERVEPGTPNRRSPWQTIPAPCATIHFSTRNSRPPPNSQLQVLTDEQTPLPRPPAGSPHIFIIERSNSTRKQRGYTGHDSLAGPLADVPKKPGKHADRCHHQSSKSTTSQFHMPCTSFEHDGQHPCWILFSMTR